MVTLLEGTTFCLFRPCKSSRRDNPFRQDKWFQVTSESAQNYDIVYLSQWLHVQRDSMYKKGELPGAHSQILTTRWEGVGWGRGGGGSREVHILYPKKSQLQNLSTKKYRYFFSIPQKSLSPFFATSKNLLFFSQPKNIAASFMDPKNHFWPKFQTQKSHSTPPRY